jgi:serine/threonine protein kinase
MENLEPIKVLGEGAFGKVYLMRHKVERALCCVKVIKARPRRRERGAARGPGSDARPRPPAP